MEQVRTYEQAVDIMVDFWMELVTTEPPEVTENTSRIQEAAWNGRRNFLKEYKEQIEKFRTTFTELLLDATRNSDGTLFNYGFTVCMSDYHFQWEDDTNTIAWGIAGLPVERQPTKIFTCIQPDHGVFIKVLDSDLQVIK